MKNVKQKFIFLLLGIGSSWLLLACGGGGSSNNVVNPYNNCTYAGCTIGNVGGQTLVSASGQGYLGSAQVSVSWNLLAQSAYNYASNPAFAWTTYSGQIAYSGTLSVSGTTGICNIPAGTYNVGTTSAGAYQMGAFQGGQINAVGPATLVMTVAPGSVVIDTSGGSGVGPYRLGMTLYFVSVNGYSCAMPVPVTVD